RTPPTQIAAANALNQAGRQRLLLSSGSSTTRRRDRDQPGKQALRPAACEIIKADDARLAGHTSVQFQNRTIRTGLQARFTKLTGERNRQGVCTECPGRPPVGCSPSVTEAV